MIGLAFLLVVVFAAWDRLVRIENKLDELLRRRG